MASHYLSKNLIADRYASALYEISVERKSIDDVLLDLKKIKMCIDQNKDFKLLIKSPLISSNEKLSIIEKLFSNSFGSSLTLIFMKVVSNNKRFASLPLIILRFININSKNRGEVIADITSAEELSDKQKIEIINQLESKLGNKLLINYKINKNIIGGLIVKVGSQMIDTSLISKINKIKFAMRGYNGN